MKKFFSFIIRQSVAILLIVGLVLGFGVYLTLKTPVNLLPDINVPMVCVQVVYPGANAQSVEKDVTKELEEGFSSISGITDVESYSYDNLSALVLSFAYGTDTDAKKADINSKLTSFPLPSGISTKVYDIDLNAEALAKISVTGDAFSFDEGLSEASEASERVAKKIKAIDGVESVEIKGKPETSYVIQPYGGLELIAPLLVKAFSYGALDIPLGNISEDGSIVEIRNNSDVKSEEDIKDMPVTLPESLVSVLHGVKVGPDGMGGIMALVGQFALMNSVTPEEVIAAILVNPEYMQMVKDGLKQNPSTADMQFSSKLIGYILTHDFPASGEMTVRVRDIADVSRRDEYPSYVYYTDGKIELISGNIIEIYKSNGANSAHVVSEVKKVYTQYLEENDGGINIHLLDDQSEFISDSISNVLVSMLIGGVLAVIVIFLFLKDWRTSLIIAVTMPLSVLSALICLNLMGITLNMVSLGGLAVGIGMLVDNSIVVIESVTKHKEAGKSAFDAAVDGTCEVGGALIGSTLTTVCVFIPIIFSGGLTGEIFTDLSWSVIFSLTFSLIVAVTVIPALFALICGRNKKIRLRRAPAESAALKDGAVLSDAAIKESAEPEESAECAEETTSLSGQEQPEGGKKSKAGERWENLKKPRVMNGITSFYGRFLPKALNKKLITILLALCVFGASVAMLFITGTEFLPAIDKGQLEVNMTYVPGVGLEDIQEDAKKFADDISKNIENVDYVSVSVGKNGLLALSDTGIINVQLTTNRHTDKVVEKVGELAEEHRDSSGICKSVNVREIDGVVASLMSGADSMSVTVMGEDADTLREIGDKIMLRLEEEGFKYAKTSSSDRAKQYTLRFDRQKIEELGLDYQTVVMTLRIGMASYTACTVNIDDKNYAVNVAFADGVITSAEDLENFVVGSDSKHGTGPVKLKDILAENEDGSKIYADEQEACIRRQNGKRTVTISATLPNADTGSAGKKMQAIAKDVLTEYNGYSYKEDGITEYLNDAFSGLVVALIVSFVLLYGVMAVQFGSWLKPLIVMTSIPFSFTGGFLALVITGTRLNVVSFIGLIMLMGVVVNNAIVMLEKIKQLHDGGMEHYTAVQEACKVRLRPILMTTLTTILALIPLAIGIGKGSELMQPLGIVVMGGLLIGTLVTLIIVPTVYCAVHRLSAKRRENKIAD